MTMYYASTINKLQQIQKEVDSITDKLGLPVDEGIKKAVVAFRLSGFPTSGSCEGHRYGPIAFPWIDIDNELWNDRGREDNEKHFLSFEKMLKDYRNHQKFKVEKFGIFGAFRVYADRLEDMNEFADYLVRRYDFCSSPELKPTPIYMEEKDYQDLLEWVKENESSAKVLS